MLGHDAPADEQEADDSASTLDAQRQRANARVDAKEFRELCQRGNFIHEEIWARFVDEARAPELSEEGAHGLATIWSMVTTSNTGAARFVPPMTPPAPGICTEQDPAKASIPINCIDYKQAATYCGSLGRRLPTEAEWELAARGTDNRTFPWGEEQPIGCELAATSGCTRKLGPTAIHPKGAGPYGTLDQAGNVWEWVADTWSDDPSKLSSVDPAAPAPTFLGVLRGGSWDFSGKSSRSFSRLKFSSGSGHVSTGVRCAQTAP